MQKEVKIVSLFVFSVIFLAGFIFAIPLIEFVPPTLSNYPTTTNNFVIINVSIIESSLSELIYNWNGANFTFFNNSLVLMFNFDNQSSLGENESYIYDASGNGNNVSCSGVNYPTWNSSGKFGFISGSCA